MAAVIGYAAASLVMPLLFLLYEGASSFWRSGSYFFDLGDQVTALIVGAWVAAVYGALPALPLIALSEFSGRRGLRFSILAGALVGATMFAIMQFHPLTQAPPGLDMLIALTAAGSLCGVVYQLVAGRLLPTAG
ncbi:hypothetical protein LB572_22500 [Mesorhizobium sp. BH1-1-5]|uniref:hypothetical protein n=1 Tax=unclassified Mesorhizobium TaxID=325217 RepID=UPI00112B85E2|nr:MULTISPECIES: hypothetical protein [unclassified Mesorhizobium]MBZ9989874.1 hypothetical protein [Mesorhizobium sp. BH1-1-5]TPJ60575.1 hypothetical protein FJ471_18495 [Mesorhizobium sp. B2-7-1]